MAEGIEAEVVACSGALTIGHAEEVRDRLYAALETGRDVLVDCTQATNVDLSFIQLLLAAQITAGRRGISLRLRGGGDALSAAVRAAGLLRADGDFWTGGI